MSLRPVFNARPSIIDRIKNLRTIVGSENIGLMTAKRICLAGLDVEMTGDYENDIRVLAEHLKKG
jgi:hypothetical protein